MREREQEEEMATRANFAEETVPQIHSEFAVLYDLFKVSTSGWYRFRVCCPIGQSGCFNYTCVVL